MALTLSSAMLKEMQSKAAKASPDEICGLLLGQDRKVVDYQPAKNVAENPAKHFEIDPAILIAAERDMRNSGPAFKSAIIGYYHSHPTGDVRPSLTDAQSAAPDGRIWLIISETKAAAWRAIENGDIYGRFDAVRLVYT